MHKQGRPHVLQTTSSVADVQAALSGLHARERTLSTRLEALLGPYAELKRDLVRLDSPRAVLGTQLIAARSVSHSILADAAGTAGRLSGRVRALDLEKSRVEDALRVVEQVAELKACVAGVVGSMGAPQDWEAAAGYIARAGRIPDNIVRSGFANAVVPTIEVPDMPSTTLETARESLCGLFLREFEKAGQDGDDGRATRFFKLFPLIGRGDVGLDAYGRYVCQGVVSAARGVLKEGMVAAGARKDGSFYVNAFIKLFGHIAQIIDNHGGLVERHYGMGKMVRVIDKLQLEADAQGGVIIDLWSDEKQVDRKLTEVRSYPFSFLVRSFLPPQKASAGNSSINGEDEGINIKDVDTLLSEVAAILRQWSLYSQFIARKYTNPHTPEPTPLAVPDVLARSNLQRKLSDKLIIPYNLMSTFFLRGSIEKALQLDEAPRGLSWSIDKPIDSTPPYIISAVDDVMYIVNVVLQRAISTSQREIVSSVIPATARVLSSDFVGMLQRKIDDGADAIVQGGASPDKVITLIVLISSLEIANEYLARIISSLLATPADHQPNSTANTAPPALEDLFPFENDVIFVTKTLQTLSTSFISATTTLRNNAIQILFNHVMKPCLRAVLIETFRNADYCTLLEAENDDDEEHHVETARRFEHGWDGLVKPIARIMAPKPFAILHEMAAQYLSRVLEKRVWSYAGRATAHGAIRMERDIGDIVGVVTRVNYNLRESFSKTMQILMVANMEEDEWEELRAEEGEDGMSWVLGEEEKKRARDLVRG